MTTIAPGGALHEGPTRPRALLPAFGPQPSEGPVRLPALLPGMGFLRPVLRPVLGPVVRPVRPVLSPVLRAVLPAHLRARPLLPPAPRKPAPAAVPAPAVPAPAVPAPAVPARGRRHRLAIVLAGAATGVAGIGLAVELSPPGVVRPAAIDRRAPAAAVPVAAGARLLDARGADLGVVATAPAGVPRVVAGGEPGTVATRVDGAAVAAVLAVRGQLPPALAREVTAFGATSVDGVWLALGDGARVEWGSPARGEDKVAALAALRAAVPHAARYDVSAPDTPAVTPR
jgi:hypothetical protein